MTDEEFRSTIQQIINVYRAVRKPMTEEVLTSLFWDERRQRYVFSEERMNQLRQMVNQNPSSTNPPSSDELPG